jgi:hypothetical protein
MVGMTGGGNRRGGYFCPLHNRQLGDETELARAVANPSDTGDHWASIPARMPKVVVR